MDETRLFVPGDRTRHNLRELGYEQWRDTGLFVHRDWTGDRDELGARWVMGDEFEI